MVRVAPISLTYNSHDLWFDPCNVEVHRGDTVVVLTARGTELGRASGDIMDVSKNKVKSVKGGLKPVLRLANEEDLEKAAEMEERGREAMSVFREEVEATNVDMRPVSVEFVLDGSSATFYFEAEERVDFRELVRRLAGRLHVRVDMRQIGSRDEARVIGGIGHCGQELCCARIGGVCNPVSIRMAKAQDLSLNPQKISGLCGRLMCCLRYEYDIYKDFKECAPKINSTVQTPEGPASVVGLDVPRDVVEIAFEEGKPMKVPLASFAEVENGKHVNEIGDEAWDEVLDQLKDMDLDRSMMLGDFPENEADSFDSDSLSNTANDAGKVRSTSQNSEQNSNGAHAKSSNKKDSSQGEGKPNRNQTDERKRRRRSTTIAADGSLETTGANQKAAQGQKGNQTHATSQTPGKAAVRPGQKSSGLAHDNVSRNNDESARQNTQAQESQSSQTPQNTSSQRKKRNRNRNRRSS